MRPALFRPVAAACLALALLAGCDSDQTTAPVPGPPLSQVVVNPSTDTLQIGQTRQFVAQAYDTAAYKIAADELMAAAGVRLLFHAWAAGAVMAPSGRVGALLVETKSGRRAIVARAFVDASGDGASCSRSSRGSATATP